MACRLPNSRAHAGSFIPVTESNLGPVPLIPCEGSYVKNLRRPVIVCLVVLLLTLFSLDGILIGDLVFARSAPARGRSLARGENVSADLRERMRGAHAGEDHVRVILQLKGKASGRLNALLQRGGVRVRGQHRSFDTTVVELPASTVAELSGFDEVEYVSLDREVRTLGHVSATTGADLVRTQSAGPLSGDLLTTTTTTTTTNTTTTLDGTGVGIALLDSGIDTRHKAFLGNSGALRVVASRDFTGEGRTDDPYGHGTHVSSIAAGNGRIAFGRYIGIAPNADIINLRVLNSRGAGSVSAVLGALDWVLQNHAAYNVRVVNMSLGMPAVDSYRFDPLCRAVRQLVDAGVVVVAAAGNNGKNGAGQKVYGQIHSPGDEPSALTVGAANTFGTDARGDDTVATYSSRGPMRSYRTDGYG